MHFFNTQIKATKVVFYFVIPKLNRTFAKSFEIHKGKIIFMNNYVSLNYVSVLLALGLSHS